MQHMFVISRYGLRMVSCLLLWLLHLLHLLLQAKPVLALPLCRSSSSWSLLPAACRHASRVSARMLRTWLLGCRILEKK